MTPTPTRTAFLASRTDSPSLDLHSRSARITGRIVWAVVVLGLAAEWWTTKS